MPELNLRPALASHLEQRLQAFADGFRHNLALIGPPGSGKTFQLEELLSRQPSSLSLIYCPVYRESCRSFIQRLLNAILQAGGCAPEQLPKTVAAMRLIEPLLARRLYGEAFTRALDAIPHLIEDRGRSCVLILDEFLHLEEMGLAHAFHELGKRVMTWPATLFVLSSSSPYRARLILRERLQLLFGQFELLTSETLDPARTSAWIIQELKRVRGAKPFGRFLIQWFDGYPWYLALFLQRLRELATMAGATALSHELFFRTAQDLIGSANGPLHQWCVSRTEGLLQLRGGARALDALHHVAEGARTMTAIGKRMGRGGLSESLQMLVERDLAKRNGTCWLVPDPVLRCWLSTVLAAQRAGTRVSTQDVSGRFERYLRTIWEQWEQARARSFPDQVAALFSKFDDETISLDSKTGRLPRFQAIRAHEPAAGGEIRYLIAEGEGKRWCASVQEGQVDEATIAHFEAFCRDQTPRPARKVVITNAQMQHDARVFAKTVNMWVWEPQDLHLLMNLYGT